MNVLILGAGFMQKPAIESAKELGCKVIVFDGNNNACCKNICDEFYHIDLKDTDAIVATAIEIHKKSSLQAVFTAGTDFSFAVASVAKACNLLGHSEVAAKNASDKIRMRSCFSKFGVSSPDFIEYAKNSAKSELDSFVEKQGFPLVVKPCDNMGGRGCRLVRTNIELETALNEAIKQSKTSRAIVEQYMEGPEFSIDALVVNNEVTITGFADRHIYFPPYFIEMGHSMPTNIDAENYNKLIKTFVDGIHALGLTYGAAKADIKLTKNGPMIGEIAGRLSGGYMSGWTYPLASGLNLTKQALLIALGKEPVELLEKRIEIKELSSNTCRVYDYPCEKHCIERAWLTIPGKIKTSTVKEDVENLILPRLFPNSVGRFPTNNVEKAGNIVITSDSREKAERKVHDFMKTVYLELDDTSSTKEFLAMPLNTEFPPSAFKLPCEVYDYIEKNADFSTETLPDFLQEYAFYTDWNGITVKESFEIIQKIKPHKKICINSLIRGGIQGALFSKEKK